MSNADTIYLIIKDSKARVLDDKVWKASDDYGLFHITPTRKILDGVFLPIALSSHA